MLASRSTSSGSSCNQMRAELAVAPDAAQQILSFLPWDSRGAGEPIRWAAERLQSTSKGLRLRLLITDYTQLC